MDPDDWMHVNTPPNLDNNLECDLNSPVMESLSRNLKALSFENENEKKEDEILIDMRNHAREIIPTTIETAIHFLQFGYKFKLPFLARRSARYLEKCLSMDNVLNIYQVSCKTQNADLKSKAEEFIQFEFEEISKVDKQFCHLKVGELLALLTSDKLNIQNEEIIFKAIVRWVNFEPKVRTEHVPALMKTLRLYICSHKLLETMVDDHLIKDFKEIQNEICAVAYLNHTDSQRLPGRVNEQQRLLGETLFVVGGEIGQCNATIETFSTSKQQWIYHESLKNDLCGQTSVAPVGQRIFVFVHEKYAVFSFDPIKKEWDFLGNMMNNRRRFCVAVLNDLIYVLGGYTNTGVTICDRYETKSGVWTNLPSLSAPRFQSSASSFRDKVFIAGGFDGCKPLGTVEMFDPDTNRWMFISSMNHPRNDLALIAEANDYLWSFGGHYGTASNKYVEKYDPESGNWITMPEMPIPRFKHSVALLYGNFYLIGNVNAARCTVDVYNPRRETWTKASDLNFGRYNFGACVIKDLSNAAEYTVHGN